MIELRLLGITTLDEANKALLRLLEKHNQRFAVKPKDADSAYIELDPAIGLKYVFTIREFRQIGPGNTVCYGGKIYTP